MSTKKTGEGRENPRDSVDALKARGQAAASPQREQTEGAGSTVSPMADGDLRVGIVKEHVRLENAHDLALAVIEALKSINGERSAA